MPQVTGVVARKSSNEYGHGILVDGNWYNSKFPIKCEEGDTVSFDDGGKKWCRKLSVVGSGGGAPVGSASAPPAATTAESAVADGTSVALPRDRAIIRQNALTNAVSFFGTHSPKSLWESSEEADKMVAGVLHIASMFEAYTSGDTDVKAVKEIMNGDSD